SNRNYASSEEGLGRSKRIAIDDRLLHHPAPDFLALRPRCRSSLSLGFRALRVDRGLDDFEWPDSGQKLVELVQRDVVLVRLELLFDVVAQFEDRVDQ